MKTYRTLTTIGGFFVTASLAVAQYAPAAPPAPPAPRATPAPRAVPAPAAPMAMAQDLYDQVAPVPAMPPMPPMPAMAPIPPMPPMPAVLVDPQVFNDIQVQLDNLNLDFNFQQDDFEAQSKAFAKAQEKLASASAKAAEKFNFDALSKSLAFQQGRGPAQPAYPTGPRGSDDSMYQNGLRNIDNHQYDQALSEFNNVAAHSGPRAEGALYWKAYVLNKLGRGAEAQAAIDLLRKTYPSSRWLDDSKALELEVKQSKGPVSAEAETDEDIKVLALNVVMQSDPEKALPQVENMLKGSHSWKLKRQALYVIAQSSLPKAQQDLEQIARGGNPDLQILAIQYLAGKHSANTPQLLQEIYTYTTDPAVKQAILNQFSATNNRGQLMNIVRNEQDGQLRSRAMRSLGDIDGQPELWQIYQSETTTEGKINVLNAMARNGNTEKLAEVARTDKDPKVRQKAITIIASQESGTPSATLVSLYSGEQDEKVKQTIIDNVSNGRNCQPLVDIAKSEKNVQLKLRIVQRLSGLSKSCPAGNDYLMELLSK